MTCERVFYVPFGMVKEIASDRKWPTLNQKSRTFIRVGLVSRLDDLSVNPKLSKDEGLGEELTISEQGCIIVYLAHPHDHIALALDFDESYFSKIKTRRLPASSCVSPPGSCDFVRHHWYRFAHVDNSPCFLRIPWFLRIITDVANTSICVRTIPNYSVSWISI